MPNIPIPKRGIPPPMNKGASEAAPAKKTVTFAPIGKQDRGQLIVLAGKGGTGKTTAAMMKPGKTAIIDLEGSAPILKNRMTELAPDRLDELSVVEFAFTDDAASDYENLCATVEADGYDGFDTIVLDSWSIVQKLLKEYTFRHEMYKGKVCTCSDDYGYSTFPIYAHKGFTRLFNAILAHVRAGRDFIIIAHAVDETVPDAALNDMKQWQFDAFVMKTGKESIRHDLFNNADQVWFMDDGAHASTAKDDKKKAMQGSRMVYFVGTGTIMAKSRTYSGDPAMMIPDGSTIPWDELLNR